MGFASMENLNYGRFLTRVFTIILAVVCLKLIVDNSIMQLRLAQLEEASALTLQDIAIRAKLSNKQQGMQLKLLIKKRAGFWELKRELRQVRHELLRLWARLDTENEVQRAKNETDGEQHDLDLGNINMVDLAEERMDAESHLVCAEKFMYYANVTVCAHDPKKDTINKRYWEEGSYRPQMLQLFGKMLIENPDWIVLDIGAHLGQYSILAAKLDHFVLSVEPFADSNTVMRRAARLSRVHDRILLLRNLITSRRSRTIEMRTNKAVDERKREQDEIDTILFDDLLDVLPIDKNEENTTKTQTSTSLRALLKIDTWGAEPLAFRHASRLFAKLDIRVVLTNWRMIVQSAMPRDTSHVEHMIKFLRERAFAAYDLENNELRVSEWKMWPVDVVWRKRSE